MLLRYSAFLFFKVFLVFEHFETHCPTLVYGSRRISDPSIDVLETASASKQ